MSEEIESQADGAPPLPAIPAGMQALIEAQLGEALKMMRDFSAWVHHPQMPIHECIQVSHALGSLMDSSSKLVKIANGFDSDAETRHRTIVEYANPRGEGVAKNRKRLSDGKS